MMKKILRSPITTAVLFLLAAGLLLTGAIGGARAATLIRADQTYRASLELANIGIEVREEGAPLDGDLFQGLLAEGETFAIGKEYGDALSAANTGSIDEYIRVTIHRYWQDRDGNKIPELDPELIELSCEGVKLDHTSADYAEGWVVDTANSTDESVVLYYSEPVAPGYAVVFADALTVSGDVLTSITRAAGGAMNYDYENVTFHVEAVADGVQVNNAELAITSAWGDNFLGVTG